MENNNQTPVEWYYDKVIQKQYKDIDDSLEDLLEQAKEMEKQKDAKYNEILEMLKYFVENNMLSAHGDELAEKLIKEATQI
jgi:hypothetical protein